MSKNFERAFGTFETAVVVVVAVVVAIAWLVSRFIGGRSPDLSRPRLASG